MTQIRADTPRAHTPLLGELSDINIASSGSTDRSVSSGTLKLHRQRASWKRSPLERVVRRFEVPDRREKCPGRGEVSGVFDRVVIPLGSLETVSPVFIVGTGRCGSTLLRLMLNRNSQLAVLSEAYSLTRRLRYSRLDSNPSLARFCRDWTIFFRERSPYPDVMQCCNLKKELVQTETFAQAIDVVASYYAKLEGKPRWGEKSPGEVQHLFTMVKAFPNARIIHMTRDPRAQVCSFIINSRQGVFTDVDVYNTAKYWVHCEKLARRFRARHPQNIIQLRYEDLVASPRETLSAICAFLGIAFEEAMLDTASTAQRYAPKNADGQVMEAHKRLLVNVNAAAVTGWKQTMPARSTAMVEAVTWRWLTALGYAEGAAPDLSAFRRFALEICWYFDCLKRTTERLLFRTFWVARLFVEKVAALPWLRSVLPVRARPGSHAGSPCDHSASN